MDITEDNLHATLYHVCKDGAPDYVTQSKMLTKQASAELPDALFADRTNRRYPIDTKANTWLSAAYFAKTAEADNYSSKTMRDYVESVIKLACSYFDENAFQYPPAMRKEIAKRIFTKCAEYGIQPSDRVRTEAGEGFQMREFVAAQLADRVKACGNRGNLKMASALADVMKTLLTQRPDNYMKDIEKVASIIDKFDRIVGFDNEYGKRFHSPAEVFHGRNIKEAKAILEDSVRLGGRPFSISKLAELPMPVFTAALGDAFAASVKTAEVLDRKKFASAFHRMSEPNRNAVYRSILVYVG